MNEPSIVVRNLTKKFITGNFVLTVLKGLDLDIFSGELLMVVGPSGCGKSTLLNIIAGILPFEDGEVHVGKTALKGLDADQLADYRRTHIGFVFQSYYLINTITVRENVAIPLLLSRVPEEEAMNRATQMIEKVGLVEKDLSYPHLLSGGQRQRVAIARALIGDPPILICDEPTAALDAESGAKVMEFLAELAKSSHRCTIVVTHDPRIFKFATRIIHMEDGVILTNLSQ